MGPRYRGEIVASGFIAGAAVVLLLCRMTLPQRPVAGDDTGESSGLLEKMIRWVLPRANPPGHVGQSAGNPKPPLVIDQTSTWSAAALPPLLCAGSRRRLAKEGLHRNKVRVGVRVPRINPIFGGWPYDLKNGKICAPVVSYGGESIF